MYSAFQSYGKTFSVVTETAFIMCILFLVVFGLCVGRKRLIGGMREDIFASRGILNLIPEEFFEENKENVESLIKKLKD